MARFNQLNFVIGSLSKRLVVGGLIIHAILIPSLFYGIAVIVKEGYEQSFIDRVRSDARTLSVLISREPDIESVRAVIDDILFEGKVLFATIAYQGKRNAHADDPFVEDFFFGQHGDGVYYIGIPMEINNDIVELRLGYDEVAIEEQVQKTYTSGLYLALGYVLLSMVFGTWMGSQVTRPIRELRDVAREVASGASTKQLDITTTVTEVRSLAQNLESMRQKLVQTSEAMASREMYMRDVMDNVMDGIITVNELGKIESLNPAVEELFGYERTTLLGDNITRLFVIADQVGEAHHKNGQLLIGRFWELLNQCQGAREIVGIRSDKSQFPVEITSRKLSSDRLRHHIIVVRDITARKQADAEIRALHLDLEQRVLKRTEELADANEQLEYQAMHDSLTDLPNRVLLQDRLEQAIQLAQRHAAPLALLVLDLNNFKEINDTLGHHVGDLLLQQVADRMRRFLRASDTIARAGGDEFAVLLPTDVTFDHVCQIGQKIVDGMAESFVLEDQHFHVGVSVGIALYPEHGEDGQTLMRHADVAMYVAKRKGAGYSIYDVEQDEHSLGRLELMGELHKAIEQNELVLYYQPKFDLALSRVTEVEVLIRWHNKTRGLLFPDSFIGLAEHNGLIHPLTEWVIDEALSGCQQFNQLGLDISVAINLSMHNLRESTLPQQIFDALEKHRLSADRLILELTESAVMSDPRHAMDILNQLDKMGVRLAIDDFGTGYSSLAYLKQLPVDEIKIDKSFVLDMLNDNDDLVIVRSTIDLAHNMGRKVTAEGVETEAAWNLLASMGCDLIQGYHIARPMPAGELIRWLAKFQHKV